MLVRRIRRVFLALGLTALGLTAIFILRFVPIIPSSPDTTPASPTDAQRLDLTYLRSFPRYDRSLRDPPTQERFTRFVDSLLAAGGSSWTDAEFEVLVAQAAALADNGHTSISAAARRRRLGDDLPIRLARFAEGYVIVQATEAHASLLGARLDAIGGVRVAQVLQRLRRMYGGVDGRAQYQAHLDLTSPSLLHGLGVAGSPSTVHLALTHPNGRADTVTLERLPHRDDRRRPTARAAYLHEAVAQDSADRWRSLNTGVGPPLPLQDPGARFAVHRIAGTAGTYLRIDGNEDAPGERIKAFAARAHDSVVAHGSRFVVVDLRHNGGGTTALGGFARGLVNRLPSDGRVYVIVSGGTFSYGIATAALLRKHGGVRTTLLGEPLGDRLQFWANGGSTFRLPHSGITLRAWSGLEDYRDGCWSVRRCFWLSPFFLRRGVGDLEIDTPVPLRLTDYLAGRDSALEWVKATEAAGREAGRQPAQSWGQATWAGAWVAR